MLWFSGKSKQSVVLNSQAFIDATEYIPVQVSGDGSIVKLLMRDEVIAVTRQAIALGLCFGLVTNQNSRLS
jgi:hypothetical protein